MWRFMERLFGRPPTQHASPSVKLPPWKAREEQLEEQIDKQIAVIRENLALIERRKECRHE